MTRIELEPHDDVITAINKLRNIDDTGVEIFIPADSVLLTNGLNLKLLKQTIEDLGKVLHFEVETEEGQNLLDLLEDPSQNFVEDKPGELTEAKSFFLSTLFSTIKTKLRLPSLHVNFNAKLILILGIFGLMAAGFAYKLKADHRATVRIVVDSQPLARSVSIKVLEGSNTNADSQTLKGIKVEKLLTLEKEIDTTGEKLEGDTATGTITVYNKTTGSITLKKGTKVIYKEGEDDLTYKLEDELTIPAMVPKDSSDPASVLIPGQADAQVEAADIGSHYNIDDSETLEIDDYKKTELVASSKEKFTGGKSETVKVVAEEDLTSLSSALLTEATSTAEEVLADSVQKSQEFITGSTSVVKQKEEYSHDKGEETEKVKLVATYLVYGLAYSDDDLDNLVNSLVDKYVPEEFEVSKKDRDVKVEILGATDSSVLSSTEADLQVTIKTYVVPRISEDSLKSDLQGKKPEDAQKVLGSLGNIKTYELKISPGVPFLQKVPGDTDKISIDVVKEN